MICCSEAKVMICWFMILVVANHLGNANCQFEVFKKCNHAIGQSIRDDQGSGLSGTNAEHCQDVQVRLWVIVFLIAI